MSLHKMDPPLTTHHMPGAGGKVDFPTFGAESKSA